MPPRLLKLLWLFAFGAICAAPARAATTITFTRAEVNTMANLFETDGISVSPLPNAQYPLVAGTWMFMFPHSNISADGDIHTDLAINSAGVGANDNNTGASPLVTEVINATQSQLNHVTALNGRQVNFRGIFRLYTEHASERHFELHPVTQLLLWNGAQFVSDTDYHGNIVTDPDGTTHANSTLINAINGSQSVTAVIGSNNNDVTFTFPSPSVNYVEYAGVTTTGRQSDALGEYFMFRPNLVPSVTIRCRLVSNTAAANAAANFGPNQSATVNALTRTDVSALLTQISTMTAGQQKSFPRPVELIVLGLPGVGPSPTPTPTPTPTATPTPTPGGSGTTFSNPTAITFSGANGGTASPYPSSILVSGLIGKITKVTAQVNGITQSSSADDATDLDVQVAGPTGQGVMLMSDIGNTRRLQNITLGFDDAASNFLSQGTIVSGTYKPTNYSDAGTDTFPAPAPAAPAALLAAFNNLNPNGTWNLFVHNDYSAGQGTVTGGWSLTITTTPSAPFATTNAASAVSSSTATLNGAIDPLGQATNYWFEFGPTASYGFINPVQSAGNGTAAVAVNLSLAGLTPGTVYHYRVVGGNNSGTANGADRTFTTAAFADNDGDGMPNDYESTNGFNPNNGIDGAQDFDGDGMTNQQEFAGGTNPKSPASVLRIVNVERAGGDISITFPTILGKSYTLEQSPAAHGPWSVVTDDILGTGAIENVLDVEAIDNNALRFYRVKVSQ